MQLSIYIPDVCGKRVRGTSEKCSLNVGHRGCHSTVTFTCEICDKRRRGRPIIKHTSFYGDDRIYICFLCEIGKTQ